MTTAGPYRGEENPPRYICIVCWLSVSSGPGTCSRDGAPLQAIDGDLATVEELRRRAREKKVRPQNRAFRAIAVASLLSAVLLHALLIACGVYDFTVKPGGPSKYTSVGGGIFLYAFLSFLGFFVLYVYVFKWTGLFRPVKGTLGFDPDTADIPTLVRWLELSVDGRQVHQPSQVDHQ